MLFFLAVSVLVVSANAKFYTDCGSKQATVQNVSVGWCTENTKECLHRRNTNATISIDFTPSKEIKSVRTVVHGVIMNLPVPFSVPQPDACQDSGLTCPLTAGKQANYRSIVTILSYPKVKVDIKWELKDENGENIVCVKTTHQNMLRN